MKGATYSGTIERLLSATKSKTETDLAAALGIKPQSVWQAKDKDRIPAQWFVKISLKYGVSVDWLVSGVEPPAVKPVGACSQCIELMRQLSVANERLYQSSERERALMQENSKLKAINRELESENTALKDRFSLC